MHKGASTFIADELARYLVAGEHYNKFRAVGSMRIRGREPADIKGWPQRGLVGVRIYPAELRDLFAETDRFRSFADNAALVFVQRDPRDAAVSLFYSKAFSHTTRVQNKKRFVEERKQMQEMSPTEGVKEFTARPAIAEFSKLHDLHEEHGGILLSYEDLVTNSDDCFEQVGRLADWPDDLIDDVKANFTDSSQPPDAQDPLKHKRRITPGNWKDVFDDELERLFERTVGDRLRANGYT